MNEYLIITTTKGKEYSFCNTMIEEVLEQISTESIYIAFEYGKKDVVLNRDQIISFEFWKEDDE